MEANILSLEAVANNGAVTVAIIILVRSIELLPTKLLSNANKSIMKKIFIRPRQAYFYRSETWHSALCG